MQYWTVSCPCIFPFSVASSDPANAWLLYMFMWLSRHIKAWTRPINLVPGTQFISWFPSVETPRSLWRLTMPSSQWLNQPQVNRECHIFQIVLSHEPTIPVLMCSGAVCDMLLCSGQNEILACSVCIGCRSLHPCSTRVISRVKTSKKCDSV